MLSLGQDELRQAMGVGYAGEMRQGPDGNLYQWVQGVDRLGNSIGQWRWIRRRLRRFVRRAIPVVQQIAPFFPTLLPTAAALRVATPALRRAGIAGDGLGALYQAPDGSLYQLQGVAQDDELQGFDQDDELQGFDQGYVPEDGMSGLEGYVPEQGCSPPTRWFIRPVQPPEMWRPLW